MKSKLIVMLLLSTAALPLASAHPASDACPIMGSPTCWSLRLTCYYADPVLHNVVDENTIVRMLLATNCRTQPDGGFVAAGVPGPVIDVPGAAVLLP